MNAIVVDTNVINYMLKKQPQFEKFRPFLERKQLVLSFASVAELFFWKRIVKDEKERKRRMRILQEFIRRCMVIHSSLSLCIRAASLAYLFQKRGSKFRRKWHDIWIAATAIELNIPLVTNNKKDFSWIPQLELLPKN